MIIEIIDIYLYQLLVHKIFVIIMIIIIYLLRVYHLMLNINYFNLLFSCIVYHYLYLEYYQYFDDYFDGY